MKKIPALGWFILFCQMALAQTEPQKLAEKEWLPNQPVLVSPNVSVRVRPKTYPTPVTLKQHAESHILALKDGVLLVRLRTSENAIKKLMEGGNEAMANTLRRQQEAANLRLLTAFRNNFTFAPVYFFFSSDSEKVRNGQTTGILLNDKLKPDASIVLPDKPFYVAEITDLEQFRPDPENPDFSNNPEVSFKALVMRDSVLHQLARPFPYFIKANTTIPPRRRSETEMVILLNQKLKDFYRETLSPKN